MDNKDAEDIREMMREWIESGTDDEFWEFHYPLSKFKEDWVTALSEEHCGDCVCAPNSCPRCQAEEFFDRPSSVDWCKCYFYMYDDHKCEGHKGVHIDKSIIYESK